MRIADPDPTSNETRPASYSESPISHAIKERLIGVSRWVTEARAAVAVHAAHDGPVLIEGEPGSGKEFVARLIHECSARRLGPFMSISCDTVSEASVEAALFGWVRPLPAGGTRTQKGLIEAAEGGMLYINGSTSFSSSFNAKLARLIQHQEFRRVGDDVIEIADVRIILGAPSAWSRGAPSTLEETALIIAETLSVPPLRRRRADIEPLSRHFVKDFCQQLGKESREIAPETIALMRGYDWPGSVSELKRVIKEMVRRSGPPRLEPALLPATIGHSSSTTTTAIPSTGIELTEEVERFERMLLCEALKQCHGVQSKAAQLLGLKLTTLNTKIARYGINVSSFK